VDSPLPETLAGLRVVSLIASGGFASVYEVEDARGGRLAVKQLHPEKRLNPGLVEGFAREARFLVSKKIPGVVRAMHFEARECALVMEYLDGYTLEDIIRGASDEFEVHSRLVVGVELCSTLQAIHSGGHLHLDLKPDNVFLCMNGRVVLLDFGVAAAMAGKGTGRGPVMGAINYMSPELLFQTSPPDSRSDIYSLGVVLYEFLSGSKPYSIEKGTMLKRALERVRPLDAIDGINVTSATGMAIQRCLSWEPSRRWTAVAELGDTLRREVPSVFIKSAREDLSAAMGRVRRHLRKRPATRPRQMAPVSGIIEEKKKAPGSKKKHVAWLIPVFLLVVGMVTAGLFLGGFLGGTGKRSQPPAPIRSRNPRKTRVPKKPTPTPTVAAVTPTPVPTPRPTPTSVPVPVGNGNVKLIFLHASAKVVQLTRVEDGLSYLGRLNKPATPMKVRGLPAGKYRVKMRVEDTGATVSGTVVVRPGKTSSLRLEIPAAGGGG